MDGNHATILMPANPDDPHCPTGRITTNGTWTTTGARRFYIAAALAHGDLTGDGSAEAVVPVSCVYTSEGDGGDGSGQRLTATNDQRYGDVTQQRTYRWNGQRFVPVDGPTTFPTPS